MQRTRLADVSCSIARTLDVVGEWWTLLVVRDLALGLRRFEDLRRDLGIASNVLVERLDTLLAAGLATREPYQFTPVRYQYTLTPKGADLVPVLYALQRWGDSWTAGDAGPPVRLRHDVCREWTSARVTCAACGGELRHGEVSSVPGPGLGSGRGTAVLGPLLSARAASARVDSPPPRQSEGATSPDPAAGAAGGG